MAYFNVRPKKLLLGNRENKTILQSTLDLSGKQTKLISHNLQSKHHGYSTNDVLVDYRQAGRSRVNNLAVPVLKFQKTKNNFRNVLTIFFYYSKMYINKITQFTYDLNPKAISFEKNTWR